MAVTSSYRKTFQSPVLGSCQTGSLSRMVRYHCRFCSPGRSPCEACGIVSTSLLVSPMQLGSVVLHLATPYQDTYKEPSLASLPHQQSQCTGVCPAASVGCVKRRRPAIHERSILPLPYAAARTSSSFTGGSRLNRGLMFLTICPPYAIVQNHYIQR